MTTLEGLDIIAFLKSNKTVSLEVLFGTYRPGKQKKNLLTTNEFARKCLTETLTDDEEEGGDAWDFSPCVFLQDNSCSIYPVRPFGCRGFASTSRCDQKGFAEVPELIVILNTLCLQLIEHLDLGGLWGNINDVLFWLLAKEKNEEMERSNVSGLNLKTNERIYGFLVPPEEQQSVRDIYAPILSSQFQNSSLGELINIDVMGKNGQ